jgi:3-deoxy-D-manno-octulosonic-acid transferase
MWMAPMEALYRFALFLYLQSIRIAAFFNEKAARWIDGRIGWEEQMRMKMSDWKDPVVWMHCASLGEFEQGRTVLEEIRKEYPQYKTVLTFFSPSGYEVLKNTKLADAVFYLPPDSPANSKLFIDILKPCMAIFVKYEFWHYYALQLHQRKIPFYCVSAIFRPSQVFFSPIGAFFKKMLLRYNHIFVQDQDSLSLLYKHGITKVTVAGDTRFDRVWQNRENPSDLPLLETFCSQDQQVMVAGSTWPQDEHLLFEALKAVNDLRVVIAPHELNASHLEEIAHRFGSMAVFYSKADEHSAANKRVLVIDNIGMLSRLYRFGQFTYVGGGFGAGIHNTLEAAVYGKPVIFGPRYDKFREAKALVKNRIGYPFTKSSELIRIVRKFQSDPASLRQISDVAERYMQQQRGATGIIMSHIQLNFQPVS